MCLIPRTSQDLLINERFGEFIQPTRVHSLIDARQLGCRGPGLADKLALLFLQGLPLLVGVAGRQSCGATDPSRPLASSVEANAAGAVGDSKARDVTGLSKSARTMFM